MTRFADQKASAVEKGTPIKTEIRGARLKIEGERFRFELLPHEPRYQNAQWDDYQKLKRGEFLHRPPLVLECEARWSNDAPVGTSGFGFWNDPFMMTGWRWPSFPKALWFFYAGAPSKLKTSDGSRGVGLRAMAIDAWNPLWILSGPFWLLCFPLFRWSWFRARVLPYFQKALGCCELDLTIEAMKWKHYRLEWGRDRVRFFVDARQVLETDFSPKSPLGLVVWMDNQFMRFDLGSCPQWGCTSPKEPFFMDVRGLRITHG